jgi:uncharacterized protein (DUF58 family)
VVAAVGGATGATALIVLAAGGLLFLGAAFVSSRRALLGLRLSRSLEPTAFEEDPVRVVLALENRGRRPAALVEILDSFGPALADRQRAVEPGPLGSRRRRLLAYRSSCSRGFGEFRVGPLQLLASDPFGLFRAARLVPQMETFTVFPRAFEVAGLDRMGALPSLRPESATLGRPGLSLTHLGVRDYRSGDEPRRIHWRASARRRSLASKEFETDLAPYLTLLLDLERSGRAGTGRKSTLEYLVRVAVSILWTATRRGDIVQLIAEGASPMLLPPGRGQLHATACSLELVRCRQEGRRPVLDVLEDHRGHLPRGSSLVLVATTASLEPEHLSAALSWLLAGQVRVAAVLIDESSFLAIERPQLPLPAARERADALLVACFERGVPATLLDATRELAAELPRPDLLGGA